MFAEKVTFGPVFFFFSRTCYVIKQKLQAEISSTNYTEVLKVGP